GYPPPSGHSRYEVYEGFAVCSYSDGPEAGSLGGCQGKVSQLRRVMHRVLQDRRFRILYVESLEREDAGWLNSGVGC
ncbi:hypothetical protein FOZ63_003629, partial [Perkinsus olseni]